MWCTIGSWAKTVPNLLVLVQHSKANFNVTCGPDSKFARKQYHSKANFKVACCPDSNICHSNSNTIVNEKIKAQADSKEQMQSKQFRKRQQTLSTEYFCFQTLTPCPGTHQNIVGNYFRPDLNWPHTWASDRFHLGSTAFTRWRHKSRSEDVMSHSKCIAVEHILSGAYARWRYWPPFHHFNTSLSVPPLSSLHHTSHLKNSYINFRLYYEK